LLLLMLRFEQMVLRWQSWAPERTGYIRCFDSGAAPAAFPEFPEVSELAPGMQVFVIYNVDDGSPMRLRGTLAAAISDAAEHGFVVLRAEYA
jgi:hypothetical protein